MTPAQFVAKWSKAELSERAASQEHFIDLCNIVGQPTPAEADATGQDYCFEKHVKVVGSASKGSKGDYGFVDVWKRGYFAWEYKGKDKHKTLDEAYRQVYQYRDALDNPPLTVVCDISTIEIRAHFNNYPTEKTVIKLEEIPGRLEVLRRVFTAPDTFKPAKTREELTGDLADVFGDLADKLLSRSAAVADTLWQGHGDPVAHFLMKVMFCLFAEDIGLLPDKVFTKLVNRCMLEPENFAPFCGELFDKMKKGGWYGNDRVDYFNGGLFDDAPPLALGVVEMPLLAKAATRPWQAVEPSIFGTLFERILDPKKRAQIGAHYTSKADILLVIDPVIMTPLKRKWAAVQETIAPHLERMKAEKDRKKRDVLSAPVRIAIDEFRKHLGTQRILDPACGSGNFLYVALQQLLNLDDEVVRFVKRYDIDLNPLPYIRPTQLHGIEINPYAAELAQVVVWIGYLQWIAEHNVTNDKRPILDKLVTIKNEDAILDLSKPYLPMPRRWDEVDFIIGNPPFLGSKIFRNSGLSDDYLKAMWKAFDLPRSSDLCCYWFELARRHIETHSNTRAGLLATQGIRGGDNRTVLERIKQTGDIFEAWSDREWVLDGAMVHVSIVAMDNGTEKQRRLDGESIAEINADLRNGADFTEINTLDENLGLGFMGVTPAGKFDITLGKAREFLAAPNASGNSNADVVRPWVNAIDLTGRGRAAWIIDFGCDVDLTTAASYEAPFEYVRQVVAPTRAGYRTGKRGYWCFERPRPDMRRALGTKLRYLVTPLVSKHRPFTWVASPTLCANLLVVFARSDDYFFGVLQSSIHEIWARRQASQLREAESGTRYTTTTCFETFALPWTPEAQREDVKHPAYLRIAAAAKALNEQRERWLNPPEWIDQLAAKIDAADTFDDVPKEARALVRESAIMAAAAKDSRLKKRTLTNLYNERPTWLKIAHETLDRAVLAAYAATDPAGEWPEDWATVWTDTGAGQPLPTDHTLASKRAEVDQKVLANLLRLNHARAKGPTAIAAAQFPRPGNAKPKRGSKKQDGTKP